MTKKPFLVFYFILILIAQALLMAPDRASAEQAVFGSKTEVPFSLKGNIYYLKEGTDKLPNFDLLNLSGTIYATELNITSRPFDKGFPGVTDRFEWFAIDYKGTFSVKTSGQYRFKLTSDDGSKLFIDGKIVIDNDGVHPPYSKEAEVFLKEGSHNIEVQYFQGPRFEVALVLEVAQPGKEYDILNTQKLAPPTKEKVTVAQPVKQELSIETKTTAGQKCIDSEGEAIIVNNDTPSAKTEAIARAKWSAMEQVVGVEVKAQSVVQNMALVDDAVSKQIKGIVSSYKILKEEPRSDIFWVKINACVEATKAEQALSTLAMNNSIAVFIPAKKPKVIGEMEAGKVYAIQTVDEYEETNILSETLIGKLTEQGFTVVDVAPTETMEAADIENAIKSGNFLTLRSLMYKFLSNMLLIGKIDYTISTKKGQDIGYGISMPFNNVTVRLTYRIVTRDPNSGKMVVLAAGPAEGKGLAGNVEDATAKAHKDLAEKFSPVVLDKVSQYIRGMAKKVNVKVNGISDISTNFAVKDIFQNISWVSSVEEKGLGDFIVSYSENPVYLANSISQKGNFQIVNFSTYSITLNYQP